MTVHHISETALVNVSHDLLTDSAIKLRCALPLINLKDHAFLQTTLLEKRKKKEAFNAILMSPHLKGQLNCDSMEDDDHLTILMFILYQRVTCTDDFPDGSTS